MYLLIHQNRPRGCAVGPLDFERQADQLVHARPDATQVQLFVHEGRMELVLGRGADRRTELVEAGAAWRIPPGTVHRFRAVTDCLLFEVSTSELEDVVRLEDDYGREGTTDRADDGAGGA